MKASKVRKIYRFGLKFSIWLISMILLTKFARWL